MQKFLNKYKIEEDVFAAAVSGGADSLAMVLWLNKDLKELGKRVVALTVDHGLRPESKSEAEYVAKVMQQQGIEHHILTWKGEKPTTGIEGIARVVRYRLLADWCQDNDIKSLFVGHHHFDQAETFFLRLQRGSGLNGLCGIAEVSELNGLKILRPMLEIPPEEMKKYLTEQNIKWVEDSSNEDDAFLRNRIRKFLPIMEEMTGISVRRITDTMATLARTKSYIDEQIEGFIKNNIRRYGKVGVSFSLKTFQELHEEMEYNVLRQLLIEIGDNFYAPRSKDIQRLCSRLCANKFTGIDYYSVKLDDVQEICHHIETKKFTGATLGKCEVFVFQDKVWIVPELKSPEKLAKKEWEDFLVANPNYSRLKLPYKLRNALVRMNVSEL